MLCIAGTVIAAAKDLHLFNNVNFLSGKIAVSNQIGRTRKGCNAAAYEIYLLVTVLFFH